MFYYEGKVKNSLRYMIMLSLRENYVLLFRICLCLSAFRNMQAYSGQPCCYTDFMCKSMPSPVAHSKKRSEHDHNALLKNISDSESQD